MRRMRLLLLGKNLNIVIDKPAVQIEVDPDNDDEDMLKWEHALNQLPGEEKIYVGTQIITDDLIITSIEIDTGLEDIELEIEEELKPTPKDEYDQKISCSYQVCSEFQLANQLDL